MSDISFAQFDLLSAMQSDDFVVGYRGTREVRLTYLSLISGISGININSSPIPSEGTGVPVISSNSPIYISTPERVYVNESPLRVCNISTSVRSTLSPLTGDIIYNTTTNTFQGYTPSGWVDLS